MLIEFFRSVIIGLIRLFAVLVLSHRTAYACFILVGISVASTSSVEAETSHPCYAADMQTYLLQHPSQQDVECHLQPTNPTGNMGNKAFVVPAHPPMLTLWIPGQREPTKMYCAADGEQFSYPLKNDYEFEVQCTPTRAPLSKEARDIILNNAECEVDAHVKDLVTADWTLRTIMGMLTYPEVCRENDMVDRFPTDWGYAPTFFCPPGIPINNSTLAQCELALDNEARQYFHNSSLTRCPPITNYDEFDQKLVKSLRLGRYSQEPIGPRECFFDQK